MGRAETPRRSSSHAFHLVVMAKSPVAGRVKRRLAREIGAAASVAFYRTCLANSLRRLAADPRFRLYAAITPDRDTKAALWGRIAPAGTKRIAQGPGDLGRRMQRLFRELPPGPAIIVGSDIPAISITELARAFRLLGRTQAVFGAAPDGGYWLIGLKRVPRVLDPFARVRWSTEHALADTLANLDGQTVAFVAEAIDVDGAGTYRALRASWQRLIPPRRK